MNRRPAHDPPQDDTEIAAIRALDPAARTTSDDETRLKDILMSIRSTEQAPSTTDDVIQIADRRRPRRLRAVALVGVAAAAAGAAFALPQVLGGTGEHAYAGWTPTGVLASGPAASTYAQRSAELADGVGDKILSESGGTEADIAWLRGLTAAISDGSAGVRTDDRGDLAVTVAGTASANVVCFDFPDDSLDEAVVTRREGEAAIPTRAVEGTWSEIPEIAESAAPGRPLAFRGVLGADVTGVTFTDAEGGPDITSTILDGAAVAWWPGGLERVSAATLTFTDGTTKTVELTSTFNADPDGRHVDVYSMQLS